MGTPTACHPWSGGPGGNGYRLLLTTRSGVKRGHRPDCQGYWWVRMVVASEHGIPGGCVVWGVDLGPRAHDDHPHRTQHLGVRCPGRGGSRPHTRVRVVATETAPWNRPWWHFMRVSLPVIVRGLLPPSTGPTAQGDSESVSGQLTIRCHSTGIYSAASPTSTGRLKRA